MFTIGQKPMDGRTGRAWTAMTKFAELSDDQSRREFLDGLQEDNRWSNGTASPAAGFTQMFFRSFNTIYHYPVYKITFSSRCV